jgi:hypothetical protein
MKKKLNFSTSIFFLVWVFLTIVYTLCIKAIFYFILTYYFYWLLLFNYNLYKEVWSYQDNLDFKKKGFKIMFKEFLINGIIWEVKDILRFLSNPYRILVFCSIFTMNLITFLFRFILFTFVWYPYWVIKLYYYLFSKDISELKPDPSPEWQQKILYLNRIESSYTPTLKNNLTIWFLSRINAYTYFMSFHTIYNFLSKFVSLVNRVTLTNRFLLLLTVSLYLVIWITTFYVYLLLYYTWTDSFEDSKIYKSCYNRSNLKNNVSFYLEHITQNFYSTFLRRCIWNRIYKSETTIYNFSNYDPKDPKDRFKY